MKYLVSIDLNKNELQNARIQNLATAPSAPVEGQIYYSTADKALYYYDGSSWVLLASGAAHNAVTLDANADVLLSLTGQTLGFDSQSANRVLAAPNGSSGVPTFRALVADDIPTLTAAKISDFDTQVRTNSLSQMTAPAGNVAWNSKKITGLADPADAQDAATKNYVDTVAQGLNAKASVKYATTGDVGLSGTGTTNIDVNGGSIVAGNRILVKNQATASQNGIYIAASGAWTRALDADTWAELVSAYVFVEQGATLGDTSWVCTVNTGGTLDSTSITWVQFGAAGAYTAGDGLDLTGSEFSLDLKSDGGLQISSTELGIKLDTGSALVLSANGLKADVGTASTQVAAGNHAHSGMASKYSVLFQGNTSATYVDVVHNLGTQDVLVSVRTAASADASGIYEQVYCDVSTRDANTVRVSFATAPSASDYYKITVIG